MSSKLQNFLSTAFNKCKEKFIEKKLLDRIKDGLKNSEFKMYLQFIVDTNEMKIRSAETLSRWINSAGDVISPKEYMGLMEKYGLIANFDYYMFEKVCEKLSEWHHTDLDDITLSCNFTRITISEKDFVSKIEKITNQYDFDRKKLLIEITENSIEKNLVGAMYNIIKVKELGFRIALDDIGNGYTSFVSLCEYPIDVVKIDREILLLTETEKGERLFNGIVSLAHHLGLKVVCEGVETEEQNKLVCASKCDYIQGWYYFKALPALDAEICAKRYNSNTVEK